MTRAAGEDRKRRIRATGSWEVRLRKEKRKRVFRRCRKCKRSRGCRVIGNFAGEFIKAEEA